MRILFLLMFLASLGFSMGLAPDQVEQLIEQERASQIEQERARWAELVESASPACKELAVTLQRCKSPFYCAYHTCWELMHNRFTCQSAGVSVEGYLLCERKVMQGRLDEMQGRLDEMQEPARGVGERRKLGLNLGAYGALAAPLYLNRAIKRALRELRESQCQQSEDGDA